MGKKYFQNIILNFDDNTDWNSGKKLFSRNSKLLVNIEILKCLSKTRSMHIIWENKDFVIIKLILAAKVKAQWFN